MFWGNTACIICYICSHMNWKEHMACNFNILFENKGLLKVTARQVHCACGNISEMVPDKESLLLQTNNRKWCMTYRIEAIQIDDLESASRSFLLQAFHMWFFVQLCSSWQDINWQHVVQTLCGSGASCYFNSCCFLTWLVHFLSYWCIGQDLPM